MQRIFRPYDYDATLEQTVLVSDVVSAEHPARQLMEFLDSLDLTALYDLYYPIGPHPYDPRVLLALWLYGYMTGVHTSRPLRTAIIECLPFRYLAAGSLPDHTTLAEFRTLVFAYLPTLFEDLLTRAQQEGHVTMQVVSHDGTKIHANASKHRAVSYQKAGALIHDLQDQIEDLLERIAHDPASLPSDMDPAEEIRLRQERITRLQEARTVLEARAAARYEEAMAAYTEQVVLRAEKARLTGKPPRGKPPEPPTADPASKDQVNFTDPDSRIMKNSTNQGFDQHYNSQVTVEHASRLIVGLEVSQHPNDTQEALPSLDSIPAVLGAPDTICLDHGFWNPTIADTLQQRGSTPLIATGKTVHGLNWQRYYGAAPDTPPPPDASPAVQMAYQVRQPANQQIYRERKSTVEPAIGIMKAVLGFRQYALRGLEKVRGEWRLVCLAYNCKRFFTLQATKREQQAQALAKTAQMAQNPIRACVWAWLPGLLDRLSASTSLYRVTQGRASLSETTARRWPTGC
ncbi:MAG TPA: transposase [Armatimonadota bacterium]|jgi:transposase